MSEVTRILSAIEQGDPQAAEQLLPLPATGPAMTGGAVIKLPSDVLRGPLQRRS